MRTDFRNNRKAVPKNALKWFTMAHSGRRDCITSAGLMLVSSGCLLHALTVFKNDPCKEHMNCRMPSA